MPSLSVTVPHARVPEEATERLRGLLERALSRNQDKVQDLVQEWNGNNLTFSFKTFGFEVSGTMQVEPQAVRVDAKVPFAAMMFKGKIEQALRDELTKALA